MEEINKLLEGSVEDVKTRLAGKDAATLAAMLAAEQAGQNRTTLIGAIEKAQTAASTAPIYTADTDRGAGAVTTSASLKRAPAAALTTAADLDSSGPTNVAPASVFTPAGAPDQVTDIDVDHSAVDNNPRANTTAVQNRIDFNDPAIPGSEAVEQALKNQANA